MRAIRKTMLLGSALLPSFLRVGLLRLLGFKIGAGVRLGWLSLIVGNDIEIGDRTHISPFCYVRARQMTLGRRVRIGALSFISTGRLQLADDTRISRFVIVSAGQFNPESNLIVGKRSAIFPFCWIDTTREVFVDDDVAIGGATYIFTHGAWQPVFQGFPAAYGPVRIERNVYIAWRVFIVPNVTIGAYSTIGAGAVVNKDVPSFSLAAGVPAKVVRTGGEYLRPYTAEEKLAIFQQILDNAAQKLRYDGYEVSVDVTQEGTVISASNQRIVFQSRFESLPPAAVLISWESIPPTLLAAADQLKTGWFDLERQCCADISTVLFDFMKTVFSFHGVRFEPVTGETAARPDVVRARLA